MTLSIGELLGEGVGRLALVFPGKRGGALSIASGGHSRLGSSESSRQGGLQSRDANRDGVGGGGVGREK